MAIGLGLVVGILKPVWTFTTGLVGKVVGFAVENPGKAAAIVGLGVAGYFGYNFAYDRGAASREAQVQDLRGKLEAQIKLVTERNAKLEALEGKSTALADANKLVVDTLKSEMTALRQDYALNLKIAAQNPKVVTKYVEVPVPGTGNTTQVQFQDGFVVCDRYPAGYADTVNQAVKKTRDAMRKVTP